MTENTAVKSLLETISNNTDSSVQLLDSLWDHALERGYIDIMEEIAALRSICRNTQEHIKYSPVK